MDTDVEYYRFTCLVCGSKWIGDEVEGEQCSSCKAKGKKIKAELTTETP